MDEARALAASAGARGEVPVGAVVVFGGDAIGSGVNRIEAEAEASRHAEMEALQTAARRRGDWRLDGCTLFVTLEPCPMCAGLAILARVDRIVFGARDPRLGACGSVLDLTADPRMPHRPRVDGPVDEERCGELLRAFFRNVRRRGDR
jgi:tRNA(adenine34) deaminase